MKTLHLLVVGTLALALLLPLQAPAQATTVDCGVVIAKALSIAPLNVSLHVNASSPLAVQVLDFGADCRIYVQLELEFGNQPEDDAYARPFPPSPALVAGVDPTCSQKSWHTDAANFEMWIAEVYVIWDNYEACCAPLVNPRVVQRTAQDPFWVNTRNDYTAYWAVYPTHVTGEGWADFYTSGGPTASGVNHWLTASSADCWGDATFWGDPVPNGNFYTRTAGPY